MDFKIRSFDEKLFVGKRMTMSYTKNKTTELWSNFMPLRKEMNNAIGNDLYSIQIYSANFFKAFNPNAQFKKWACVEVANNSSIPEGFESLSIPSGLYAVFIYIGKAGDAKLFFQNIFGNWLPNSDSNLDTRPHFEILGEKYKYDDPASEEEVWIPVRPK